MGFYMANIFMAKDYYDSTIYRKSSKVRKEELQALRSYKKALNSGKIVAARRYKRRADNLKKEAEKNAKILVYVR